MNPSEEIRSLEQFIPEQRTLPNLSYHGKEQGGGDEEGEKDQYREQGFLPYREVRDLQPDPGRDQGWWGARAGQIKGEITERIGYPYPRPDIENPTRFPPGYNKDQDEVLVRKPWRGEGGEETLVRRDELKSEYGEAPGPAGVGEYPVGYTHPYYPHNYHPYYNQE